MTMTRDQLIDKYVQRYFCGNSVLNQDYLAEFLGSFADELLGTPIEQKKKQEDNRWQDIAKDLREIWPSGEKDGKYPWRDSVSNIAKRLELMWSTVNPSKDYSKDQILTVARKYVSQFPENTKYMRTLKYFILKQDRLIGQDGKIHVRNSSLLMSMLESEDIQGWFIQDNTPIEDYPEWEGELI